VSKERTQEIAVMMPFAAWLSRRAFPLHCVQFGLLIFYNPCCHNLTSHHISTSTQVSHVGQDLIVNP